MATQWTLLTYSKLADGGLLFEAGTNPKGDLIATEVLRADVPAMLSSPGTNTGLLMHRMVGAQVALARANIGPDLASTPQTRLGAVVFPMEGGASSGPLSNPSGQQAQVILYANDNLPDVRLVSAEGLLLTPDELDARLRKTDYASLEPDMAANILKFMRQAEGEFTTADVDRGKNWYRRANRTVLYLEEVTGIPAGNIAAVYSGISMRNAWAPDNLVAATHAVLRFAGLDPHTAEYRQVFREAIEAGGWGHDLMKESSQELRKRFGGEGQLELIDEQYTDIVDYYSDIDNFVASSGSTLRGMSLGTQQSNAVLAGLLQLPPDLVVRMAKTNNFYAAILDPENTQVVAVDVHHNAAALGMNHGPEPLGSKGVRKISYKEIADGTFEFPSGRRFDLDLVEQGEAALRDAGLSDAEIREISDTWRTIPNEAAQARYDAIARATRAAALEAGLEQASSGQALAWEKIRQWRDGINRHLYALRVSGVPTDSAAYELALSKNVHDHSVANHLEGNPQHQQSLVGLTQNASSDLSSTIPPRILEGIDPKSPKADQSGVPAIITQRPDGTSEVWVDLNNKAALRTFRHLRPVIGLEVGAWTRMVPKEPTRVRSVADTVKQLTEVDGASAEVRTIPSGAYPGNQPGNYVTIEVDSPELADAIGNEVASINHPVKVARQQVGVDAGAAGNVPVSEVFQMDRNSLESETSPLYTNDWVILTADRTAEQLGVTDATQYNRMRRGELRQELIKAIQRQFGVPRAEAETMVVAVTGKYDGGTESSFLVFGLEYDTAVELGKRFDQESIATRNGMIYTTGEAVGTYHPARPDGWLFGSDSTQSDFSTAFDVGGQEVAFTAAYDFGETDTLYGPANNLMGGHRQSGARTQLVVTVDGPNGFARPEVTDQIWAIGRRHNARLTAYTAGDLHRPAGTWPVEEHVYTDGNVTAVYRTRYEGRNPHAVRAYVPRDQTAGLAKPTGAEFVGRRTKKEASMLVGQQIEPGTPIQLGNGVFLMPPPGIPDDVRKGVLDWTFEGVLEDGGTALVTIADDGTTIDLVDPAAEATAPGQVIAYTGKAGKVRIETPDPNLFVKAADALLLLGYEAQAGVTTKLYNPTYDAAGLHAADIQPLGLQPPKRKVASDIEFEGLLKEAYGQDFSLTLSGDERMFRIIDGVMSPERAPAFLRPLHEKGLTLKPHILSKIGNPSGIHIAKGLPVSIYGATNTGRGGGIAINHNPVRLEADWGPGFMRRVFKTRSRNHFSAVEGTSVIDHTLVHEIGHQVLAYVEKTTLLAAEDLISTVTQRRLQAFGVTHQVSGYAFGKGHEFFAEAFAAVAQGRQVDPTVENIVQSVVESANRLDYATAQTDWRTVGNELADTLTGMRFPDVG